MVRFRIDAGGAVIVAAILMIGLGTMNGHAAQGLILGVLTVLSLILHECGHLMSAHLLRVKVKEIGLCLKGSYIRREQSRKPMDEAAISLSGPMVNTLMAALLWSASGMAHWLAIFNLILAASNLIPLPSSDGLRAVNAVLTARATQRVPIRKS